MLLAGLNPAVFIAYGRISPAEAVDAKAAPIATLYPVPTSIEAKGVNP